jgi:hypothetical protein
MRYLFKIFQLIYSRPIEIFNNIIKRPNLKNQIYIERFFEINKNYSHVYSLFSNINTLDRNSDGYQWDSWSGKIRRAFYERVELGFLSDSLIRFTMVLGGNGNAVKETKVRIKDCLEFLGYENTKKLLKEDYIGLPIISDSNFMTSANRAHHASHLAYFNKLTGRNFWNFHTILEWGGGYGNMARIVRRMSPKVTYIIADLPELLSLQYVYLGSLEGLDNLNIVSSESDTIANGKINLISSELLLSGNFNLQCDSFISTWALTECPEYIQKFVSNSNYFSAKIAFIASRIDDNNFLIKDNNDFKVNILKVPNLSDVHEYWTIDMNRFNS